MLDLNNQPGSSNGGSDAEGVDHIAVPGKSSSHSEDTLSSSATGFLGELLERLQESDARDGNVECRTPNHHVDVAQQDLQTAQLSRPLPHGQPGGVLVNARLATSLKRNAAGCLKGPGDHHKRDNYTTRVCMPQKAGFGNRVEQVHAMPIGPNALPFVGTVQPTPHDNIVDHEAPCFIIHEHTTPQVGMPPPLRLVEHNPEDKPVVCGVPTSRANTPERAATPRATPQPRERQPLPRRTYARMAMTEGLHVRALTRIALNMHEGAAIGGSEIYDVGSRSRSPTPESSLTPLLMSGLAEQEAIDMLDNARILHSFGGSQTSPRILQEPCLLPQPLPNLPYFNEAEGSVWASGAPMGTIDLDDAYELAQMSVADILAGWATNTNHVPILDAPMQSGTLRGVELPTGIPDDTGTTSSEESSA